MSSRVIILGAGESGTGAAVLAKAKGWDVLVSDNGVIKPQYQERLQSAAIRFEAGGHHTAAELDCSLVIKSPGIPDSAPLIFKAHEKGIPVIDELEFAFRYINGRVIAITGTNGKTTTTLLTYHLLREAGLSVALAGNVGSSLAAQVADGDHDWYVVEISSFQLDGTLTFRPHIGILTNITPDHLDRYGYDLQRYVDSKFRLVASMRAEDRFIYYSGDPVTKAALTNRTITPQAIGVSLVEDGGMAFASGNVMHWNVDGKIFSVSQVDTTLRGAHNLVNTLCAVTAACSAGVSEESIRQSLRTFRNAPHRLETVGKIRGVEFVNDSKATNVDSVVYALGSFSQPLIWIAGGIDKGNDYNLIREAVASKVKSLICLGKDNDKLQKAFGSIVPRIAETQDVRELVRMALDQAEQGDVVLLSPACASFDLFRNYEDRGDQFRSAVHELQNQIGE